jgi:hypothetical protein
MCEPCPHTTLSSLSGVITRRIVALSVFLLIVVRIHRHIAAWSSFAHAVVISLVGFEIDERTVGFLVGSGVPG